MIAMSTYEFWNIKCLMCDKPFTANLMQSEQYKSKCKTYRLLTCPKCSTSFLVNEEDKTERMFMDDERSRELEKQWLF